MKTIIYFTERNGSRKLEIDKQRKKKDKEKGRMRNGVRKNVERERRKLISRLKSIRDKF